jgi:hypothetical protein
VKARAFKTGLTQSEITSDTFTISAPVTVTINSVSPAPAQAAPGQTITLTAQITSSAGRSILQGASLVAVGANSGYISDPANDRSATLPAGNSAQTRPFTIPIGTPTGTYDLLYALWQDGNGDGSIGSGDTVLGTTFRASAAVQVSAAPPPNYTIALSAGPAAGGTVSGDGTFVGGTQRTVTATANGGYTFANWTESGSSVSSSEAYTFTLNANRTLVANFTQNPLPRYTLTVTVSPPGAGTVSLSPSLADYTSGSVVQLTAQAGAGWRFLNWAGGASGAANPVSVTMNSNVSVQAVFEGIPSLDVSPGSVALPATAGASGSVAYPHLDIINQGQGSLPWTAASSAAWFRLSGSSGTVANGGTANELAYSWDANPGTATRQATITITASGVAGSPKTVTVTQQGTAAAASYVFQPGPGYAKDIWTTSVYSYAEPPAPNTPGGGLDNDELRVGGWGDLYQSLMQFDLAGLPKSATSARLRLYCSQTQPAATRIFVDRIVAPWSWKTRLWWADRPATTPWLATSQIPPVAGQWWELDITGLYNAWQGGAYPNYGLQLRPESTDNRTVVFRSSDANDATVRPQLVIATDAPPGLIVQNARLKADRRFSFSFIPKVGRSYRIQKSTQLGQWQDVQMVSPLSAPFEFTEAAPASGKAFFRVVEE